MPKQHSRLPGHCYGDLKKSEDSIKSMWTSGFESGWGTQGTQEIDKSTDERTDVEEAEQGNEKRVEKGRVMIMVIIDRTG
jgi:hypothetical protein